MQSAAARPLFNHLAGTAEIQGRCWSNLTIEADLTRRVDHQAMGISQAIMDEKVSCSSSL